MLKILEAVIGVIAILAAFLLTYGAVTVPDIETINWRHAGFSALQSLDSSGKLADRAATDDEAGLKSDLASVLPSGIEYDVVICRLDDCATPTTDSTKITSVYYYTAGNVTSLSYKRIILYMWS